MGNKRGKAIEKLRIIMARYFEIPPDDIDMMTIMDCVERSIRNECEKEVSNGRYQILPESEEEVEALVSPHGSEIVRMIFCREAPFHDWVDKYEEFYLRSFMDQMHGRN